MSRAPRPAEGPAPARIAGPHLLRALKAGFVAWLPLVLGGQFLAWTAYAVTGAFRPWSWVKIGLLNTLAVFRVGIDVRTGEPSGLRSLFPELFGAPSVRAYVALGAGTIVAVVLLFRAGREAGGPFPKEPWRAATLGAIVAPAFAIPCGITSLAVTLRFPQADVTSMRPVVWQAFVFPLVLAVVCGAIGGLAAAHPAIASTPARRRWSGAARGAWHALTWSVVLAFLGFLVLATLRPSASAAYGRWLDGRGSAGAVVAMYHALVLPNQSVDVLTISMGSCAELIAGGDTSTLCLGGLDAGDGVTRLATGGEEELPFGPGYLLFVLVPAVSTVVGGRRAAEGVRARGERAMRAAWGGVGFGGLVALAAWAAGVAIVADEETIARLGVSPIEAGGLAVIWGVAGGALGSLLPDRAGVPEEPRPPTGQGEGS